MVFGRVLLDKHPVVRRSQRGQRAADRRVGTCEFPPRWGRGRGLNVAQMWLFLGGTTVAASLCVCVDFGTVEPVCDVLRLLEVGPLLSDDA